MRHGKFAFEKEDVIDLDVFRPHRLLYWIGMKTNSLGIKIFLAEYYLLKFPENKSWKEIFKKRGLFLDC